MLLVLKWKTPAMMIITTQDFKPFTFQMPVIKENKENKKNKKKNKKENKENKKMRRKGY